MYMYEIYASTLIDICTHLSLKRPSLAFSPVTPQDLPPPDQAVLPGASQFLEAEKKAEDVTAVERWGCRGIVFLGEKSTTKPQAYLVGGLEHVLFSYIGSNSTCTN